MGLRKILIASRGQAASARASSGAISRSLSRRAWPWIAARDLFPSIVTGGDDYEILAAVPQERCSAFREAAALAGIPVTEIGRLQAGSGIEIAGPDGAPLALERLGWDHF